MPAVALRWTPPFASDLWALLAFGEAQAGPRATAPGSIEVPAASDMPARPYQEGHDLTFRDSATPDGLAIARHQTESYQKAHAHIQGLEPQGSRHV